MLEGWQLNLESRPSRLRDPWPDSRAIMGGFTATAIDAILVDNPRRLLTFA